MKFVNLKEFIENEIEIARYERKKTININFENYLNGKIDGLVTILKEIE